MKIEDLEQYKNEDGNFNLDKLNEDIMKETNRSFNKGQEQAIKEFESKQTEKPKVENVEKSNDAKDNLDSKNEELRRELEELKNSYKSDKEKLTIDKFKRNAKKNNLTDEQIDFYVHASKIDALDDFNFDLVGRGKIDDVGKETKEVDDQSILKSQEKNRLLELAKKIR